MGQRFSSRISLLLVASVMLALTLVAMPRPVRAESSLTPVSFEALTDQAVFDRDIWAQRELLLKGLSDNILFLASEDGEKAYGKAMNHPLHRHHVKASLERFHYLLSTASTSSSPEASRDLRERLQNEFELYRSVGSDGRGTVTFTGYFQPVYKASRVRTHEFSYPVFKKPEHFDEWTGTHPTRVALEGFEGKGGMGALLTGHELAWLKTRYEAFMIHVQGSAILEFSDGSSTSIGFAAGTKYPFRGVSKQFLKVHRVAWGDLASFFSRRPDLLNEVLSQNNRFIFFQELPTSDPIGSLGVPVRPGTSIATDKLHLPPGALGVIRTSIPTLRDSGEYALKEGSRVVLDQDTGSAIRGPGRVDLFMGTGAAAQKAANMVYSKGELYYLLLKGDASAT